jgi:hypothetical protein
MLVMKRIAGQFTKQELEAAMTTKVLEMGGSVNSGNVPLRRLRSALLSSLETVLVAAGEERGNNNNNKDDDSQQSLLPDYTDVFVQESLFRAHPPTTKQSGLERAQDTLFASSRHQPIAWGNTNTKSSDYKVALLAAAEQQRPVFLLITMLWTTTMTTTTTICWRRMHRLH